MVDSLIFSGVQPLWFHVSQGMEAMAAARERSLREGRMDHAFHYASERQSELWLEVHRAFSPVLRPPVEEMYRTFSRELADSFRGVEEVHVVGLGAGGARKDRWLLEALRAEKKRVRFTPLEISPSLALLSAEHTADAVDFPARPLVADLRAFPRLPDWLATFDHGVPRLYTAYGLLPNFEPEEFFPMLHRWLRPQDRLALSANLAPGDFAAGLAQVLPQYDNAATQKWLSRVLIDWGLEQATGDYRLEIVQTGEERAKFLASVDWVEGRRLQLFFSYRYTPRSLAALVAEHGFTLGPGQVEPAGEEGVWSCRRA